MPHIDFNESQTTFQAVAGNTGLHFLEDFVDTKGNVLFFILASKKVGVGGCVFVSSTSGYDWTKITGQPSLSSLWYQVPGLAMVIPRTKWSTDLSQ